MGIAMTHKVKQEIDEWQRPL